jgi:hypothetical protein
MTSHPIPPVGWWLAGLVLTTPQVLGLTFSFTADSFPDLPTANAYLTAAQSAGNLWAAQFTDNVTINVVLKYESVANVQVANSSVVGDLYSYSAVRTALGNDALSPDDTSAVANLQTGTSASFGINRGLIGGPAWRLDTGNNNAGGNVANNGSVRVSNAGAKALGLTVAAPNLDLTIQLDNDLVDAGTYDLDRSNGIGGSQYDLIGVLAHELGHGLGMESMAETLSTAGQVTLEGNMIPRLADLFRFSARSKNLLTGAFDLAADSETKYFSVDGGVTSIAPFSRGSNASFGDGSQANHWLANSPDIGIMDPTIGLGQQINLSSIDLRLFDVIGFNPVPESGTWVAGITLLGSGGWLWQRRQRTG